ncbi:MAG: sigma-70 family RNA polymerase sigma factor [Pseudomonadota bacterium]
MSSDATITPQTMLLNRQLAKSVRRWVRHDFDADEVMQTVIAKMLDAQIAPSQQYVSRMLRNAAIDMSRSQQVRESNEGAYACLQNNVDYPSPEDTLQWQQAIDCLLEAVMELGPVSQEIFFLCTVEGYTQSAAAESMGVSLSTVEKRLAKAKRHCFKRVRHFIETP